MKHYFPSRRAIRFVSAPCSLGKTTAALDNIAANHHLTNHLYVAPSIDLVNQTLQGLASRKVAATAITSETHPKRVKGEIIRHLRSAPDCGFVLLITWNAFIDLPYFHRPDNWTIIIDEVPKIDSFYRLMLPHNYGFLADQLEPIAIDNGALALVTARIPTCLSGSWIANPMMCTNCFGLCSGMFYPPKSTYMWIGNPGTGSLNTRPSPSRTNTIPYTSCPC